MSLPRQRAGAINISGRSCGFRLLHELADLFDHVLLVGRKCAPSDFLEVLLGRRQHLIGGVALLSRLVAYWSAGQLNGWLRGSSLAHDNFRGGTVGRGIGGARR